MANASQLAFDSPPIVAGNIPMVNLDGSLSRQKSSLSGGHDTCFLATVVVEGVQYRLQVLLVRDEYPESIHRRNAFESC